MRRASAALVLVALAGCGDGAPSSVVPADATIYVGMAAGEAARLPALTSRAGVDFERDVRPWLGGPPTLLTDDGAAWDDGRGTVRITRAGG
jgi:hypothetical protein